ncbi:host attachment protein [Roseomonas chloroacetimidivorans]|uniref:host attachment protein n=1 Tax=Roseomonas chloroacetimidivorans TaxID=1766656 RepID=UPI003C77AB13
MRSARPARLGGKAYGSADDVCSLTEPEQDAQDEAEAVFAASVADELEWGAKAGRYRRLFLIAPSGFLFHLRAALGEGVRAKLRGCIDKDFTDRRVGEIACHLDEDRAA